MGWYPDHVLDNLVHRKSNILWKMNPHNFHDAADCVIYNCLQVYDAGGYFTMSPVEDTGWKVVVSAEDGLKKDDTST